MQEQHQSIQQAQAQLESKNQLLAKVASNEPLVDILDALIRAIEQSIAGGGVCSVLLLDDENHLRHGSAPNLPVEYVQAVDGLVPGESAGSCGTAAFRKEIVVVSDIATDPLWQDFRAFASPCGLKACWSVPILDSHGRVLGTFATYYQEVRSPQPEEIDLIKQMVHIAGIVIEREQSARMLHKRELTLRESQRVAQLGSWEHDLKTNKVEWSEEMFRISGLDPSQGVPPYPDILQIFHPDDRLLVKQSIERAIIDALPFTIDCRIMRPDGSVRYQEARAAIEQDESGRVIRLFGSSLDIDDRKRTETALQSLIEGTSATTGGHFFPTVASYIAQALDVSYTVVSELVAEELHVLAFWGNGSLQPTFSFHSANTPCERAWKQGAYHCKDLLQDHFPKHLDLVAMEAQSYLGIALQDAQGQPIGNLCILDKKPILDTSKAESLLRVFAARASAELERERATRALENLNQELERKVEERTRALHASEQRYRALIDSASDAIVLADERGYLLEGNQKAEVLFGYNREEIAQLHVSHIHPPEALAAVHNHFQKVVRQEDASILETTILRKDGVQVPVEISGSFVHLGDVAIAQGIMRDVSERVKLETERKQIEAELAKSEAKFRHLVEGVQGVIWSKDNEGLFTYLSPQFKTLFGWEPSEWIGKSSFSLVHPEDRPLMSEVCRLDFVPEATWSHPEFRHLHRDGHYIWVRNNSSTVFNTEGEVVGKQGILVDINQRKLIEEELLKSQQFLRMVLDTFPLSVFWKDRNSVYLGCNRNFLQDAGFTSFTELIGKTDYEMPWGETEAVLYRADDQQVMHSDAAKLGIIETQIQADGRQIWVETNKIPLRDLYGEVIGVLGTYQDISARKQAEDQLQQQNRQKLLLLNITQAIRQSLEINVVLSTTVLEVKRLLEADRVTVYRFQPDWSGGFIAEAVSDSWTSLIGTEVFIVDTYLQENQGGRFQHRENLAVSDIYTAGLQPCHIELLEQFQARAFSITPIFVGEVLWGLFGVYQNDAPRVWATWEVDLQQQISSQLGIAIQQANLYDQVQAELLERQQAEQKVALQLRQQKALGAITQSIRESLDIDIILEKATQQTRDAMHADRAVIFRLHPEGSSQIVAEDVAPDFCSLKNRSWAREEWPLEILNSYWQGQPRIVANAVNDIWADWLGEYIAEGQIKSKIIAPILQEVRDDASHEWASPSGHIKLWGILIVHACQEQRVWQDAEAQLLQQIANQIAIAIQQAHLFEQLQQELLERQQTQQQLTDFNQRLVISNGELARATRLKDEFLANMSHELRTPLNAILGMTEGLQEYVFGSMNKQQLSALQTIERSGSHLLSLINDILDVAKIESGQMELDCAPAAMPSLCNSAVAFIKQQALNKRIQIAMVLPPNLPNLMVDERRIRQVLINLLSNAVKFTPEGGQITIEVSSLDRPIDALDGIHSLSIYSLPQHYLKIAVIDTGIGIAAENIDKLFKPFIQIDGALNRQYAGTGLGLALVKRIVEIHGGVVGLTSEVGVGSRFTIVLPCCVNPPSYFESQVQGEQVLISNQIQQKAEQLILLAEDNEANVITISSYLQVKGYRLIVAKNGQEAIALAQSEHPDLILMDIQMPGADGLEAIQQIRQHLNLEIPIIALTALAMAGDKERCMVAGANDYLSKPVKLKQLVETIQRFLGH